jgi:methylmalonyl-CoA mutase N-terminal domain/subunit
LTRQVDRLNKVKQDRDNDAVRKALDRLKQEAGSNGNLMPCLIDTVKTYASLGEIMDTLKEVFGTFKEPLLI